MSKSSKSLKSNHSRICKIEIQPELINAWLSKNKCTISADKEKNNTISDCSRPWG